MFDLGQLSISLNLNTGTFWRDIDRVEARMRQCRDETISRHGIGRRPSVDRVKRPFRLKKESSKNSHRVGKKEAG
jgi:hypothetical protein